MKNTTGIIIQARTGSTRLPAKIIKPMDGQTTFLDVLLSRMKRLTERMDIVLATTTNPADEALIPFGEKYGIPVFRGSEDNVLERFIACAEQYQFETLVRVCSDNPFLDIQAILDLVDQYQGEDYLSYSLGGNPAILTHYGFFTEIVSVDALKKLRQAGNPACREHVTNCIYTQKEDFNVRFIPKEINNPFIRCTLDTPSDFENLKQIYFSWYKAGKSHNFDLQELIQYIESEPDLLAKMKLQIQQNTK